MTTSASLLSTLESYLTLTTAREQAISSNMANVDTPGFHTRDINFEGELNKAMNENLGSSANDMQSAHLSPVVQNVQGLMERPDGNNVSLDREGLLMSETQLQYQVGIQLVKHQFHELFSAISGGGQ
jgi:flagellar basal-body rod protein FlgB